MMKKLLVAYALVLAVSVNYAQSAASTTPSRTPAKQSAAKTEVERKQEVEEFITKLGMSKTQAESMRAIYAGFAKERAALEPLKKTNQADYKVKVKALGKTYVNKVSVILNPEQQKKFTAIIAERNKG